MSDEGEPNEVVHEAEVQEAQLEAPAQPSPGISADHRAILGGTGQNVLGLAVFAVATAAAQLMMTRTLGPDGYGVVTQATRFTFIAASATRFGMDVADVRLVAILAGREEQGRLRGLVRRSVGISAVISAVFAALAFLAAGWLAESFSSLPGMAKPAFQAAALGIPLAALAFTYMGATRGLKVMRFTLYGQWIGQPLSWIILAVTGWVYAESAGMTTMAYSASWGLALVIAWFGWSKLLRPFRGLDPLDGEGIAEEHTGALLRFGALRAPAALFAHLVFFTDLYVLGWLWREEAGGGAAVGIYGATLQVAQSLFLFLTSVSLTFSPFVADLHHKGERRQLDGLYKTVTRWTLAATIPMLLVLAVLPEEVMRVFGAEYVAGASAMRILIIGMIVPVMVGTVGFILIMVGRTGWDLLVYTGGFAIDIGVATLLARPSSLGIRGAAIAQALTLSFSAIVRLLLVHRFVHIWPFNRQYLRLVVPTVVGAGVMLAVNALVPEAKWFLNLAASAAAGTFAYGALMLAVGLSPTERAMLGKTVSRLTRRGKPAV